MQEGISFVSQAYRAVRRVALYVILIGVLACAMVSIGWHPASIALGVAIAGLAGAMVFEVRRAVTDLHHQSHTARRAAAEAEKHYVEVLRRIVGFVEGRDPYLAGHSENVGRLARQIAQQMALAAETCDLLALAGELHDIGLLAVSEHILEHVRFGVEEFRSVQKHSEASYDVLRPLEMLAEVLPAIRHHHERFNGTGYPAGQTGREIPLGARILAVADAYDAMTHDRPHRPALSPLAAMREMRRCTPAGYDPDCVGALAELLNAPALEDAAAVLPAMARV